MTSVAWVPPFFFNGATQATTTLVVWVAPPSFYSLGLFRSVFQHLYWGSPAAACVTLCCREGLARSLSPHYFALRDSSSDPYTLQHRGNNPAAACVTLCLSLGFSHPHTLCFKGGSSSVAKLYMGEPG